MENTITPKEIAQMLEVSPKALRRFIRSQDAACGKGNRYSFSIVEAKVLIRDFSNRPATPATATRSADEVRSLLAN